MKMWLAFGPVKVHDTKHQGTVSGESPKHPVRVRKTGARAKTASGGNDVLGRDQMCPVAGTQRAKAGEKDRTR